MPDGKVVSRTALKQFVGKTVKPFWQQGHGKFTKYAGFFDNHFYLPSANEVRALISNIQFPSYSADEFDCEDFAYLCKAETARRVRISQNFNIPWALGMAWARFQWMSAGQIDHACNWVVTNSGGFAWIEPQTKKFYPANACKGSLVLLLG